jgi:hypothetical protein
MSPQSKAAGMVLLIGAGLSVLPARAADIAVIGSCLGVVDPGEPALADGRSDYESLADQVLLTVCNTRSGQAAWRVDVRRSGDWPKGLKLWVRRAGDGVGAGAIVGGRGYVEVGSLSRPLVFGKGDRSAIPLQFKLTGISPTLTSGAHAATLIYRLTEIGG